MVSRKPAWSEKRLSYRKRELVLMGWVSWWVFRFYAASVRSEILFGYTRFLRKINPDLCGG